MERKAEWRQKSADSFAERVCTPALGLPMIWFGGWSLVQMWSRWSWCSWAAVETTSTTSFWFIPERISGGWLFEAGQPWSWNMLKLSSPIVSSFEITCSPWEGPRCSPSIVECCSSPSTVGLVLSPSIVEGGGPAPAVRGCVCWTTFVGIGAWTGISALFWLAHDPQECHSQGWK